MSECSLEADILMATDVDLHTNLASHRENRSVGIGTPKQIFSESGPALFLLPFFILEAVRMWFLAFSQPGRVRTAEEDW